jgi:glycosyltransferase involved in cell wall biosynthesis
VHITAIVPVFNEEEILPFFLDYYTHFCNYIVFYDGGSTDRSREIILDYMRRTSCHIELRVNLSVGTVDVFDSSFMECPNQSLHYIRTHGWRSVFPMIDILPEWVLVVDCDEFVWHPSGVINKLIDYDSKGISLPSPTNIQMLSRTFPTKHPRGSFLPNSVRQGYINPGLDGVKRLAFNATKKRDFHFKEFGYRMPGEDTYDSEPIKDRLKVLHYAKLGFDFFKSRLKSKGDRVSEVNKMFGLSYHYADQMGMTEADFEDLFKHPGFVSDIHDESTYPSFCVLPHEVRDRSPNSPFIQ